ncbi:hypothetical protein CHS0354_035366 [Potamilus streckersoni]|uniref:HTH cro/C1-type domain-containing protein n=1 Tax=Potamilus streckersoni TaxID=2493646 RepID=A0AAE0S2Z3_9BIVA|nr:hypothetical protein CHS0354_035366 [Potamilus streckersoni]
MKKNLTESEHKILIQIGQRLKDKREEMGLSYKKVSDVTRISSQYIKNIESGNYKTFPSPVFVKGFLRNYAQLLDLDYQPFLNEYNKIFSEQTPNEEENAVRGATAKPSINKIQEHTLFRSWVFPVGLIVVIVLSVIIELSTKSADDKSGAVQNNEQQIQSPNQGGATQTVAALDLKLVSKDENGWIRLSIDGKREFDIYLDKRRAYRWSASDYFELTMAKPGLADVFFNDVLQTPTETPGQLYTVKFSNPAAPVPSAQQQ